MFDCVCLYSGTDERKTPIPSIRTEHMRLYRLNAKESIHINLDLIVCVEVTETPPTKAKYEFLKAKSLQQLRISMTNGEIFTLTYGLDSANKFLNTLSIVL